MGTKLNTNNIFFLRTNENKQVAIPMLVVKVIENNTMYSMQELRLCIFSTELHTVKVILASFTSSTVSVHCSISLSTNFSLQLQFSQSKYSPTSNDLSHSHLQLLGFQIDPLSHAPLSINSLQVNHTRIHHHSHVAYYYKCLHIIYIYTYTFYAILCVLFHQFLTLH